MSQFDDYEDEVFNTEFVDQDVESLLIGSNQPDSPLEDLDNFVQALRSHRTTTPSDGVREQLVFEAAAIVRQGLEESRVEPRHDSFLRPDRRPSWQPVRAVALLGGFAMLVAVLAVGFTAHSAVPGDPLYGVDIALEQFGIGDGAGSERIEEADALLASGDRTAAIRTWGAAVETAAGDGDTVAASEAESRLVAAASTSSPDPEIAERRATLIKNFILENGAPGIGLDGDAFRSGLINITRGEP